MIVGLIGFIGVGKGTVGELLVEKGFHKDSFAKPLKDAVSIIFGWPRELLEGETQVSRAWREKVDEYWSEKFGRDFTPRQALQLMGTEAGRNVFHQDLWVISLLNRAKDKNVVVTDVRFKNEINYIRDNGGIIIRVARGEDPDWYQPLYEMDRDDQRNEYMKQFNIHISEWDWVGSEVDYTIFNNGNLQDLAKNVDLMLTNVL